MKRNMIKLGDVATYINGYAFKPEDKIGEKLDCRLFVFKTLQGMRMI